MYLTLRIGGAPLFAITDWAVARSTHRGSERLLYKPSWRTVFRRLIVSLICSAMLVTLVMAFGLPPSAVRRTALAGSEAGATETNQDWSAGSTEYLQELRRTMPADKWAELEQRVDQRRAQREEQQELQDSRCRIAALTSNRSAVARRQVTSRCIDNLGGKSKQVGIEPCLYTRQ